SSRGSCSASNVTKSKPASAAISINSGAGAPMTAPIATPPLARICFVRFVRTTRMTGAASLADVLTFGVNLLEPPTCYFIASRDPDAVFALCIGDEALERARSSGSPDNARMQADGHHPRRPNRFVEKRIQRVA